MSACDLLVIGGGPAGHSAATAYREAGGAGAVVLLAGEGRAPYERPPLSKELLRGESEPDALPLDGARGVLREHEIDGRATTARGSLDAEGRVRSRSTAASELAYRALRPGHRRAAACVRRSPAPTRRRPPAAHASTDALALREAAAARARPSLVVGSGFIGCEAAASLRAARLRGDARQPGARAAGGAARRRGRRSGSRAGWRTRASTPRYERELDAHRPRPPRRALRRSDRRRRPRPARRRRRPRHASSPVTPGLALADGGEIAADAAMRTSVPARPGVRRLLPRRARGRRPAAARRALGRRAGPGRGRRLERRRARGVLGRPSRASGRRSATDTIKYAAWGDGYDDVAPRRPRRRRVHRLVRRRARHLRRRAHPRSRSRLRDRSAADRAGSLSAVSRLRAIVVIPARDEAEHIERCLRALAAQRGLRPAVSFEVDPRPRPLHRRDRGGRARGRARRGPGARTSSAAPAPASAPPAATGWTSPATGWWRRASPTG